MVLNQKTRKKQFSFHNFLVELATKSVNFFCCCVQHPHIPYVLMSPCIYQVYWYHFPLHMQYWNRFHTQCIMQNLPLSRISGWIWFDEFGFYTIFLILWWSWHWIVSHLLCSVLIFFTVQILVGNNWKIGLKWKQNLMLSRSYGYWAENLKIMRLLKV